MRFTAFVGLTLVVFLTMAYGQLDKERDRVRYVIAFSDIERHDESMRSVTVLIKPESFSESTLADLIGRIGNRFPQPSLLYFSFYTNIDDIETPEEHDGPGSSETPGLVANRKLKEKHDAAVCVRLKTGKYGNCHMIFANGSTRDISMPK